MVFSGNLLENYLSGRFKRIVMNRQTSSWRPVLAGVPQGSIMGPLLFHIYINNLPIQLKSNVKLLADDTSLFIFIKNNNEHANILNSDLRSISPWAYNWKIFFNPDPSKLARKSAIFKKKENSSSSYHKPQQYSD